MLTFIELGSDTFHRANSNSLGAQWPATTGYTGSKIASFMVEPREGGAAGYGSNNWVGVPWPTNFYSQVTLTTLTFDADTQEPAVLELFNRDQLGDGGYSYALDVESNGDGTNQVNIYLWYDDGMQVDVLATLDSIVFTSGDVYAFAAVGSTLYALVNGNVVLSAVDSANTYPTGSYGGLFLYSDISANAQVSSFQMGSVSLGGPATNGTVSPGQYSGASLATALPNPQNLDVIQVINADGEIIWNLNYAGISTFNPSNPTAQALLDRFYGNTFSQAFSNPSQLNIFQVVSQGGAVVFHVDYQGNAVTP